MCKLIFMISERLSSVFCVFTVIVWGHITHTHTHTPSLDRQAEGGVCVFKAPVCLCVCVSAAAAVSSPVRFSSDHVLNHLQQICVCSDLLRVTNSVIVSRWVCVCVCLCSRETSSGSSSSSEWIRRDSQCLLKLARSPAVTVTRALDTFTVTFKRAFDVAAHCRTPLLSLMFDLFVYCVCLSVSFLRSFRSGGFGSGRDAAFIFIIFLSVSSSSVKFFSRFGL